MKSGHVVLLVATVVAAMAGCSNSSAPRPEDKAPSKLSGSVSVARQEPIADGTPCTNEAAQGYSLKDADVSIWTATRKNGDITVGEPVAKSNLQPGKAARVDNGTPVCLYAFSLEFNPPTPEPAIYRLTTTGRRSSVDVQTYTRDYSPSELRAGAALDIMLTS